MTIEDRSGVVLGAVEALFGAGTTVAPMAGATLLRHLPKMADPWTNGLHLDQAPDLVSLGSSLDTWEAFERPGRLRWVDAPRELRAQVAAPVRELVAGRTVDGVPAGLMVAARPVFHGRPAVPWATPDGVGVDVIAADIRDWAGFEILARWIDLGEDPKVWRWRATRVRNLVQGGRGVAALARVPASPVGAAVLLEAPDHRPGAAPVVATVVHEAHRGRGIVASLIAAVASEQDGPITVLGDGGGHLGRAASALGLAHVADLVEVGPRPAPSGRKA